MIEKKKVILTKEENDNYIYDLLCFGYEVTYQEKEYEDNKKELVKYPKINVWLVLLLWCFIIPGMLYYDLKSNDIKAIDQQNEPLLIKMYNLTLEAKKLRGE